MNLPHSIYQLTQNTYNELNYRNRPQDILQSLNYNNIKELKNQIKINENEIGFETLMMLAMENYFILIKQALQSQTASLFFHNGL